MMIQLPEHNMPEAEVSLRLAFYLISIGLTSSTVRVSIDGAQVRTNDTVHFPIIEFLQSNGWGAAHLGESFQGHYTNSNFSQSIEINSIPGHGDVVADLVIGRKLRVECKKGPLVRSKSSLEYRLLREALGQLLTISEINQDDLLAVAVPDSQKFRELVSQWRAAPLLKRVGIALLTVDRNNNVNGLDFASATGA